MSTINRNKWSEGELDILIKNYAKLGLSECLKLLPGRKLRSMTKMAAKLGIKATFDTDIKRFETRFRITPSCWQWIRGKDSDGYGQFYSSGKNWGAHRFSYSVYVGEIPNGLCVCHKCDNPQCVNPNHLFLGTNEENTADRHRKGRSVKGQTNWGGGKLKKDQIRQIKASNKSANDLAVIFKVHPTTIRNVKRGITWAFIDEKN